MASFKQQTTEKIEEGQTIFLHTYECLKAPSFKKHGILRTIILCKILKIGKKSILVNDNKGRIKYLHSAVPAFPYFIQDRGKIIVCCWSEQKELEHSKFYYFRGTFIEAMKKQKIVEEIIDMVKFL